MAINLFAIDRTHRSDGMIKVPFNQLELPLDFILVEQVYFSLPAQTSCRNHLHARREIFSCLSEQVEFVWKDNHHIYIQKMMDQTKIYLIDVLLPPHAIRNLSNTPISILEFANAKQGHIIPSPIT